MSRKKQNILDKDRKPDIPQMLCNMVARWADKQTNNFHYSFLVIFMLTILEIVLGTYIKRTTMEKYTLNYNMVRSGLNTVCESKSRQSTVFQYDLLNKSQTEVGQLV